MRALSLVSLFVFACTPEGPGPAPEVDGSPFLSLDPEADFYERARLVDAAGEARLVPGGDPLPSGPYVLPDTELVVVDTDDDVRVSWSDRTLQLLPWIERHTLEDVIAAGTEGRALHADGEGVVVWPAGHTVEMLDAVGDRVLVGSTLGGRLRVETWVHAMAVDQVFDADARQLADTHEATWRFTGEILDAPRGQALAWTLEGTITVASDGSPVDGYHPVRHVAGGVEVLGWAHEDDLEPQEIRVVYGGCGGCFGHGSMVYGGPTNLPAQTPVHAWPEGPVVGQTLRALSVVAGSDGWATLSTATPWGEATVVAWVPEG